MIAPGALVLLSPLVAGFVFGPQAVAGLLAGIIVSGIQVAISASNTGGAWDNCNKEIEKQRQDMMKLARADGVNPDKVAKQVKGMAEDDPNYAKMNEWAEKLMTIKEQKNAAVVGDTVGDPLKDTSGPAINILVKLSAITSLVFGGYLENYHIFENVHKEPTTYDWISTKCNEAGENPNTQEAVLAYCKTQITNHMLNAEWGPAPAKKATTPATPAAKAAKN